MFGKIVAGPKRVLALMGTVGIMIVLAVAVVAPPVAVGQATRTWVSGVGDDVNPCSRTAPCKTFAGAISKTAAGGEINCIDSGGFGAVTIIKSMTIDCSEVEGGALAGGNGIVLNMPATTDVAVIRGLDIFGVNPPSNGIRFVNNGTLHVDNVRIKRFNLTNSFGISYQPSGNSELYVSNTLITDNGTTANGGGILIQPTGTATAKVTLDNVDVVNNFDGIRVDTTGATGASPIVRASIATSTVSGNQRHGIAAVSNTGGIDMVIDSCVIANNSTGGGGITASGANALVRVGRSTITGNLVGTNPLSGGVIQSYQTNQIDGNINDGTRTNISQE
jgi:hypothetical protein